DHDGRVPRGTDPGRAPDFFAGGFVNCDERAAFDAGVDDEGVLVKDRRRARTPAVSVLADQRMPKLLAVEIKTIDSGLAEEDVEALPLDDRRAGRITVVGPFAFVLVLGQDRLEFLGPNDIAGRTVEAKQVAAQLFHFAGILDFERVTRVAGHE